MMKSSNNKETINLLDLSDNDSDISDLIFTPKKKKIKRRHRINRSLKVRPDNVYSCRSLRMKAILLWLTTTLIMIWLVILSWLTVILYGELRRMDITIKSVIAGSEGVPDVLQTCHTLDKNYKTNLTNISDQIKKLNRSLNIFSGQIFNLQQELRQIQISFKSAPELTSVPNIVKALQNSIGELEIDVHDLQTTYKLLKNTTLNLQYSQDQQIQSLTKLKNTLLSHTSQLPQKISNNETLVEKKKLWDAIEELHTNLTHINQTLTMNITWAQEDLSNDHKKIVSLQDMTQNTNSQILLLQQECIDRKDQKILQNLLQSLSNRIDKLSSNKTNQERPHLIEQKHNILINSTDNLLLLTHTSSETVTHKPKILSTIQKNMKNWKLNQTMKRQCTNGHLMCAGCFTHVLADARLRDELATCPNCRIEISKTSASRNLAVEKAVSELPAECQYCAKEFPRNSLERHEEIMCEERISSCKYSRIGCPWRGPNHERPEHEAHCVHPHRTGADVMEALHDMDAKTLEERKLFDNVFDLLSYEKITFNDLQMKPYRTDEFVHKLFYETSRFTAFNNQWVVTARINNSQRDPTQSSERDMTYQLILKTKTTCPLSLHYLILKGPFGDMKVKPRIHRFDFTEQDNESPYLPLPLPDTAECNRLLAAKAISFRLIMFLASK